jgi:hypothetical protein
VRALGFRLIWWIGASLGFSIIFGAFLDEAAARRVFTGEVWMPPNAEFLRLVLAEEIVELQESKDRQNFPPREDIIGLVYCAPNLMIGSEKLSSVIFNDCSGWGINYSQIRGLLRERLPKIRTDCHPDGKCRRSAVIYERNRYSQMLGGWPRGYYSPRLLA